LKAFPEPSSHDIPFAEVFPILLYVLLFTLTTAADGLYEGLGRPRPDALSVLEQLATWLTVCAWFYAYADRWRIPLIVDFGWLIFGVWMVVVPYFLFKTQRWRALLPIAGYVLLVIAVHGLGWLVRSAVSRW
jgi:hypothetical protein